MCGMCPGVVDVCYHPDCKIHDGHYGNRPCFEIGDTFCEHLQAIYGHAVATTDDYYNGPPGDENE